MTTQTLAVLSRMLADPTAEHYGTELSRLVGLKSGTIYPLLDRLLKAGWLERRWEAVEPTVEGRPRRRLYRLTPAGAAAARVELDVHRAWLAEVLGG